MGTDAMGTNATGDDAELARLDDVALQAIAYGRGSEGDANGRMLAERAQRILASRRPAPAAGAGTPAARSPGTRSAGPRDRADQASREGADAERDGAEDDRPARRIRTALVAAVGVGALIAAVIVTMPREPAAFGVFAGEASAAEAAYERRLAETGDELYSGVRILVERALAGGESRAELVAFRTGTPRSTAAEREVCLAVFGDERLWSRTCLLEEDFVIGSVTVEDALDGAVLAYEWGPDGGATLEVAATGPSSLGALAALDLPALDTLTELARDEASPLVRTIDRASRPNGMPEALIGPAELARVDEAYILVGLVRLSRTPGGELEVCATATRLGIAAAPIDHRCVTVTQFAAEGLRTAPAEGLRPFVYEWRPDGTVTLEGLTNTP